MHIKNRIYKTNPCSGDFSQAKEFLEVIIWVDWYGEDQEPRKPLVINDELEIWIKNSFEIRIPVFFAVKIFVLQKFVSYQLFRSPTIVKNGADSYIIVRLVQKTIIKFEVTEITSII